MGRGETPTATAGARRRQADVVLIGSEQKQLPVTPGVIDERAYAAYTQGQCHALALALHEATGWQIYGAEDEVLDVCHLLVMSPDRRALDISGCHPLIDYYELEHVDFLIDDEYLVPFDPDQVRALGTDPNWREPDVETARSFVEPLLREVGLANAFAERRTVLEVAERIGTELFPEPDEQWGYDYEHDWCGRSSGRIAAELEAAGIRCRTEHGSFGEAGILHSWVELDDGTIVDATVQQFVIEEFSGAGPVYEGWPGSESVAVVPPEHPYRRHYRG